MAAEDSRLNLRRGQIFTTYDNERETVVITKHAKPVAKLVPVEPQGDDIFGFLRGQVTITSEVVSPALSRHEWDNLK
ncbi:MAG TPA: type II toxin-antitoxin system prevent-host-death family antitoxin [Candidatus Angelobacter sp.]|nr:type II toxin-antitoxin system prevent-host-death family antitoxin [Candidatus Angelobacter sp.]